MNHESLQLLSAKPLRRSVGIDRYLFTQLVETLAQAERLKKKRGRPSLSLENQLCMTLSYWREYRTFFHLGLSYGVHESNVYRIVNRVESRLAASGLLALVKRLKPFHQAISPSIRGVSRDSGCQRSPEGSVPKNQAACYSGKSTLTRSNSSS